MNPTATRVYESYIKPLPARERLELLALVAQDLANASSAPDGEPKRSILGLEGLGAEIWEGIDAQDYVNKLRDEWEERRA